MVGFAADDAAQGDQCIKAALLGHALQRQGYFQGTGYRDVLNVLFSDAQCQQFCFAGVGQGIGNAGIEAGLHDANLEFLAVHAAVVGGYAAFVCTKHMGYLVLKGYLLM